MHACYRCLLEPSESKILESLNNVVLARRALTLISDEGIPSSNMTFGEKIRKSHRILFAILLPNIVQTAVTRPLPD